MDVCVIWRNVYHAYGLQLDSVELQLKQLNVKKKLISLTRRKITNFRRIFNNVPNQSNDTLADN